METETFEEKEGGKRSLLQKVCLDPCACLCTGVSDIAAKLSVVASLAAAVAVALAVAEKADLALLFAAISSTGATIAAVLAVCGSVVTGIVEKIMGDGEDSETSEDESKDLVRSKSGLSKTSSFIASEEKIEEGDEYEYEKSDKRVSFRK